MPDFVEIIIAVVVALIGLEGLGALLASRWQARKTNAEASVLISTTEWTRLNNVLDALQEENGRLVSRLCTLELNEAQRTQEVQTLRLGVVILISQLRTAGIEPAWEPSFRSFPDFQGHAAADGG